MDLKHESQYYFANQMDSLHRNIICSTLVETNKPRTLTPLELPIRKIILFQESLFLIFVYYIFWKLLVN